MPAVDLRSDTVTRPTPSMREAMARAEVGDDVFGDDPTVRELEARAAGMFGLEAGLFFPTGTQLNLAALMAHCGRGEEVIVGQEAHTYRYEGGGAAVLGLDPDAAHPEPRGRHAGPRDGRGGHQAGRFPLRDHPAPQKTYIPFFIIPDRNRAKRCERRWRDLLGDNVLCLEEPADVCYVAAGAMLLSEKQASRMEELTSLLSTAGMPSDRRGAVVRALTPLAEVILNEKQPKGWFSRWF